MRDMTDFRVIYNEPASPGGGAKLSSFFPYSGETTLEPWLAGIHNWTKYYVYIYEQGSVGYNQHFNVTDYDNVHIDFNTLGRADRVYVTDEAGVTLYDSGMGVFNPANNNEIYTDIDVTSLDEITVIVELGPDVDNTSWVLGIDFQLEATTFTQIPITFDNDPDLEEIKSILGEPPLKINARAFYEEGPDYTSDTPKKLEIIDYEQKSRINLSNFEK